jgi:hypothetical protein
MLGRDEAHWSFFLDSDNSTMEGNDWERISDDRWETNADHEVGYSELDMYLMGFMDPDDVEDWLLIGNPQVLSHSGIEASSPPYYAILDSQPGVSPIVVRGDEIQVSIEDVMSINGSRQPDFEDSQREFKMAFVIMHPASQALDFDDYLVIEDTREDLTELWEDMVDDEAVLDTSLGTSGDYEINPAGLPGGIAFEPDPTDGSVGSGCTASIAGASAGSLGLLLPLALLRRRRNA